VLIDSNNFSAKLQPATDDATVPAMPWLRLCQTFLPRDVDASAVIVVEILSACASVRQTRGL